MNLERLESVAPSSQSVDFLVNVAPALGLTAKVITANPSDVAQHYQTLLERVEAAASTATRADRRMARLSAVVLGAYQKGGADLYSVLKNYNFQVDKALLPAVVSQSAAWICEHLVTAPEASAAPEVADAPSLPSPRQESVRQPEPPPKPASVVPKPRRRQTAKPTSPPPQAPPTPPTVTAETTLKEEAPKEPSAPRRAKPVAEHPDFAEPQPQIAPSPEDDAGVQTNDEEAPASFPILSRYLKEIGKVPLLDAQKEVELAQDIEAGLYAQHKLDTAAADGISLSIDERRDLQLIARTGERANEHMIRANLRLVVSIAKNYRGRGMSFLDLIQEGNVGLMHAVKMFDYSKGHKFSTYATWWIRQGVDRSIKDKASLIRLPIHEADRIRAATKTIDNLQLQLGRPPTLDEIAAELGITKASVVDIFQRKLAPASLDREVGNDTSASLIDFIVDPTSQDHENKIIDESTHEQLDEALNKLNTRERQVITWLHGLQPMPVAEIAERLSITYRAAADLIGRSAAKLAHPSMGLDPSGIAGDDPWQLKAACRQEDLESFFPISGVQMRIAQMCGACPVREACLDFAQKNSITVGTWGGTSPDDRRRLRKQQALVAKKPQTAEAEVND
jgi:RNA polymerase sigma factor (sigma-70 family)